MSRKIFGYIRISTKEQNQAEQVQYIKEYCKINNLELDERDVVVDKISKDSRREGYKALIDYMIRSGDVLIIKELDLLGSNLIEIKEQWQRLKESNINLVIMDNEILSTKGKNDVEKNLITNVVSELLNYFGEKEKKRIKARQARGIQALKDSNNGKGIGRPKIEISKEFKVQYKLWKAGKKSAVDTFNALGLTKATFYRLVKEYENTN